MTLIDGKPRNVSLTEKEIEERFQYLCDANNLKLFLDEIGQRSLLLDFEVSSTGSEAARLWRFICSSRTRAGEHIRLRLLGVVKELAAEMECYAREGIPPDVVKCSDDTPKKD